MRVLVAHNPVSGRGNANKLSADISDALMHEGCEVDCLLTQADDPKKWLEPKLKQVDRVVAVGGDGTLRSIASCLVGTGIPIYHAPSGTENLFAKSMRMSNDAQKVVKSVLEGDVQRIDTATANGEFLLLMSSMVVSLASLHASVMSPFLLRNHAQLQQSMMVLLRHESVM